jgi:hypothetical protein
MKKYTPESLDQAILEAAKNFVFYADKAEFLRKKRASYPCMRKSTSLGISCWIINKNQGEKIKVCINCGTRNHYNGKFRSAASQKAQYRRSLNRLCRMRLNWPYGNPGPLTIAEITAKES